MSEAFPGCVNARLGTAVSKDMMCHEEAMRSSSSISSLSSLAESFHSFSTSATDVEDARAIYGARNTSLKVSSDNDLPSRCIRPLALVFCSAATEAPRPQTSPGMQQQHQQHQKKKAPASHSAARQRSQVASLQSSRRSSTTTQATHHHHAAALSRSNSSLEDLYALHRRSVALFGQPPRSQSSSKAATPAVLSPHASPKVGATTTATQHAYSAPLPRLDTHLPPFDLAAVGSQDRLVCTPEQLTSAAAFTAASTTGYFYHNHQHEQQQQAQPPLSPDQTSPTATAASSSRRQTIIDWTDPASRRSAYAAHDRSKRGLRKLRHHLAAAARPACLFGDAAARGGDRIRFYKAGRAGDDAGSVRRYRLELGDVAEEREKEEVGGGSGSVSAIGSGEKGSGVGSQVCGLCRKLRVWKWKRA